MLFSIFVKHYGLPIVPHPRIAHGTIVPLLVLPWCLSSVLRRHCCFAIVWNVGRDPPLDARLCWFWKQPLYWIESNSNTCYWDERIFCWCHDIWLSRLIFSSSVSRKSSGPLEEVSMKYMSSPRTNFGFRQNFCDTRDVISSLHMVLLIGSPFATIFANAFRACTTSITHKTAIPIIRSLFHWFEPAPIVIPIFPF